MSTPAAKRRRADAANAVLRKPFHSPVIRRPHDAASAEGATSSKTPDANSSVDAVAYSPSSPSVSARPSGQPQTARQTRSLGSLHQCQTPPNRSSASRALPLKFKTPVNHSAVAKRKRSSVFETPASDDDKTGSSRLLALVGAHNRHAAQLDAALIKDLDGKLETVRQARRIEGGSSSSSGAVAGVGAMVTGTPPPPVDQELRGLVSRWRDAARTAAEELFEVVRERVDKCVIEASPPPPLRLRLGCLFADQGYCSAGGSKAWKGMRQRQMEFYQGLDGESPSRRRPAGEGFQEELEGDDEGEGAEHSLVGEGQVEDDEGKEESEPVRTPTPTSSPLLTSLIVQQEFNMAQMLQSLNIDLSLLGYDEEEEKWIN